MRRLQLFREFHIPVELAGRDVSADLAILRAKTAMVSELPGVQLAQSSYAFPKDPMYIIGHPFGVKQTVLSVGEIESLALSSKGRADAVLKISAHSGNSGSPIFNKDADVVAIVSAGTERLKIEVGPRVEYLRNLLSAVKANETPGTYVDMTSIAKTHINGKVEIASTHVLGSNTMLNITTGKPIARKAIHSDQYGTLRWLRFAGAAQLVGSRPVATESESK